MKTALVFLDRDPKPAKQREFFRVAEQLAEELDTVAFPAHSGERLLELADQFESKSVEHLVYVMHGFTTRLMSSRAGVHVRQHHPPAVVSLEAWAEAWTPVLVDGPLITLAACMCSRSPSSTLRKKLGRVFSSWDPLVHRDGGADSFSGLMRDSLVARGLHPKIRGHTTAAHVLANPACRQHGPELGAPGRSLFNSALEDLGVEPTWRTCRRFNDLVKGELARSWVLFEDGAVERVRGAWMAKAG